MTIKEKVEAGIRDAMKKRDQDRLSALRMIKAEFLLKEKEAGEALNDSAADQTLRSMLKRYTKAREEYKSLGKQEEAERYDHDITLIESFMSAPMMDEDTIKAALEQIVSELDASEPKDFGRLMKAFMSAHSNADGKIVSSLLKEMLNKEHT